MSHFPLGFCFPQNFFQASAEFLSLSALAYGLGCAVQASAVAALGVLLGYLKAKRAETPGKKGKPRKNPGKMGHLGKVLENWKKWWNMCGTIGKCCDFLGNCGKEFRYLGIFSMLMDVLEKSFGCSILTDVRLIWAEYQNIMNKTQWYVGLFENWGMINHLWERPVVKLVQSHVVKVCSWVGIYVYTIWRYCRYTMHMWWISKQKWACLPFPDYLLQNLHSTGYPLGI